MIRRRLLTLIPTLFGVVTLVFLFIHIVPGDPVDVMLGETAQATDKAALRAQLGLDRPIGEQYLSYLTGLAQGDLGTSFVYRNKPVSSMILSSASVSPIPASLFRNS